MLNLRERKINGVHRTDHINDLVNKLKTVPVCEEKLARSISKSQLATNR